MKVKPNFGWVANADADGLETNHGTHTIEVYWEGERWVMIVWDNLSGNIVQRQTFGNDLLAAKTTGISVASKLTRKMNLDTLKPKLIAMPKE